MIDGHAHIATTLWGQPWRPHRAGPGLTGLLAHQREGRRGLAPVADRAAGLLAAYRDHGTTHIRAHVDVDPEIGLGHIEGALEAAARFAGVIDVEVVAFPQQGMLISPGTTELMAAALEAGATVIGGIDPAGLDGDPVTALDTIFGLADRSGAAIDIHLHDRGELGRWELGLIIDRTVALGLQGRVAVSHAFCLGDGSPAVEPLLERLAEHRVAIATVAPGAPDPLPLLQMLDIGVGVCLGSDGIRDLWSPWGDADLLHRAGLLAWRSGFRRDEHLEAALSTTTTLGARALGLPEHGPRCRRASRPGAGLGRGRGRGGRRSSRALVGGESRPTGRGTSCSDRRLTRTPGYRRPVDSTRPGRRRVRRGLAPSSARTPRW